MTLHLTPLEQPLKRQRVTHLKNEHHWKSLSQKPYGPDILDRPEIQQEFGGRPLFYKKKT